MPSTAILALVAAVTATACTVDLGLDYRKRRRAYSGAYTAGMAMFATATWALWWGLALGWTGPVYRIFYLFGAILNIPMLATGSMYLLVGKKSGTAMNLFTGALGAIATTLVTTVPLVGPLPAGAIPEAMFSSEGFGPRVLAAVGSGVGTSILIILGVISIFRRWRSNSRVVVANLAILVGVSTVAASGAIFGILGEDRAFEASLLVATSLIWMGHRISRKKAKRRGKVMLLLVGPTTQATSRPRTERLLEHLEAAGYDVKCPARDIENWGAIGFSPSDAMLQVFRQVDEAQVVLADLSEGESAELIAGYARALRKPVVVSVPDGLRIPKPLRAVALDEIYYTTPADIINRLDRFVAALDD